MKRTIDLFTFFAFIGCLTCPVFCLFLGILEHCGEALAVVLFLDAITAMIFTCASKDGP